MLSLLLSLPLKFVHDIINMIQAFKPTLEMMK